MANERYTPIRECLKRLLQEGCKYLYIVNNFYNRARNDYSEFQRVLDIMDNYSRHKSALQQDIDLLIEFTGTIHFENSDHDNYDDYDYFFDDYDDYYDDDSDEETETGDDEETASDEGYHTYSEWLNRLTSAIRERKNALTKLELILLEKVESYNNLMALQLQLNGIIENYCGRVVTVLKQIISVENQLNDTQLANRFRGKRMKLMKILAHITEKQKFFWGDHTSAMETV